MENNQIIVRKNNSWKIILILLIIIISAAGYLLKVRFDQMQAELAAAHSQIAGLNQEAQDLKAELGALQTKHDKLSAENGSLKEDLAQEKEKLADVENQLAEKTSEAEKFEKEGKLSADLVKEQQQQIEKAGLIGEFLYVFFEPSLDGTAANMSELETLQYISDLSDLVEQLEDPDLEAKFLDILKVSIYGSQRQIEEKLTVFIIELLTRLNSSIELSETSSEF